ncbi:30S ribosomal protein S18 [Candidatus Saccharibacteria bacterium]|nr:30S ribosomal protein S18 [Candidatus Saccharibacteria bacterium]MCB9821212.1 30S ribosomal protein S18 [Candidatus Nomurabacteria bacterium]
MKDAKKIKSDHTGSIYFDHKDVKALQRFTDQFGQIHPRKKTGLTEMQQRRLSRAVKRARHLALLPFVSRG